MAITSTGLNAATNLEPTTSTAVEDKTVLGKSKIINQMKADEI